MMTDAFLQTGDVVELNLLDYSIDNIRASLSNIATSKDVFKKFRSINSMAASARMIDGIKPHSDIIDDTVYVEHEDGTQFEFTRGEPKVKVKASSDNGIYGFVLDYAGHPFIAYQLSGKAYFEPYQKLQDKVVKKYRHAYCSDDAFRITMTQHFLMPDTINAICGEPSNYTVSQDFYGNPCLNYIQLVFSLLGVKFPEEWAVNGAPKDILTDYQYGFIEVA